ncbi:MAG: hypothetical protein PHP06_09335 [Clostridia bacterium]|nr:hypothetical protein [Clostridia bacterium]
MKRENQIKVAVKCAFCGKLDLKDISLFDFSGTRKLYKRCSCGNLLFIIRTWNHKRYDIKINCLACGNSHYYTRNYKDFWTVPANIIKCPNKDIEIAFIGAKDSIYKCIDYYEERLSRISDESFGEYFSNSYVMYETFNRIQDIADKNRLYCHCGCSDFNINLLKDKIRLLCRRCGSIGIINAGNNQDLNLLKTKDYIIIGEENVEIIK